MEQQMKENIEVRVGYYSGFVLTSEMIEIQRQEIAMKQYYQQLQDDHDTMIQMIKLKSALSYSAYPYWILPIMVAAIAGLAIVQ